MEFKFGPIQEQWLRNLEQFPERQCKGHLGKKISEDKYVACCLGEVGLIGSICHFSHIDNLIITVNDRSTSVLYGCFKDVGLNDASGTPMGFNLDLNLKSLSDMNDGGGDYSQSHTWPEIAAHVRKYGQYYFNKSV